MNFNELYYERPDIAEFETTVLHLLERFELAETFQAQTMYFDKIMALRNHVLTMLTIAQIRSLLDSTDLKYQEEQQYTNTNFPIYEKVISYFYERLVKSPFKEQFIEKYGKQLLSIAELKVNTVSSEVLGDLEVEYNLMTEYTKLLTNARIEFRGESRNLSQLNTFIFSSDRTIRKEASEKKYELMEQYEDRIDIIFDSLIQVRTKIAKKLGYNSFVELGYARLSRGDYGQDEVNDFRKMILKYFVPISEELRERQRERLKLDSLTFYDEDVRFKTGNFTPKGDINWIIEKFKIVFSKLSIESGNLFSMMNDNHLMDLTSKEGKAGGAFATYLCNDKVPYIFANLNGSRKDVKVLAHEFGHAFQKGISNQQNDIPEYIMPTKEACEIPSIAMEFLIHPYVEDLFEDDSDKYRYAHLEDAIFTMPYRASIDEFQHFVYRNPNVTPNERKQKWSEIERKYMPYKTSYNHPFLERGSYWHQQIHLFNYPFYYIDYALAQICTLQIWAMAQTDKDRAWDIYLKLCRSGGRLSFVDLLEHSGISSPFDEVAFTKIVDTLTAWFDIHANID